MNKDLTDHNTLVLQLECSASEKEHTLNRASVYLTSILNHRIFAGDEEDWYRYTQLVSRITWDSDTESKSLEQQVDILAKLLEGIISQCFPLWEADVKKGNRIPKEVRKLLTQQSQLSRKLLRSKDAAAIVKYQQRLESIEAAIAKSLSKKYLAKEKLVVANIKKDPKSFYSYAKSFQKTHQSVGPFLKGPAVCKY